MNIIALITPAFRERYKWYSLKNKFTSNFTNVIAWTNLLIDMYFMGVLGHKTDMSGEKKCISVLIAAHGSMNYNL